jgi:hypothetical protein
MKHELTIVIDKIENHKCRRHGKTSKIKYVDGKIQISACCKEHRGFLERKIEYEMFELLHTHNKEKMQTLPALKEAV